MLHDLGFSIPFGRLVFLIGRVAGLTAEVAEELSREKPMRIHVPVEYDGEPPDRSNNLRSPSRIAPAAMSDRATGSKVTPGSETRRPGRWADAQVLGASAHHVAALGREAQRPVAIVRGRDQSGGDSRIDPLLDRLGRLVTQQSGCRQCRQGRRKLARIADTSALLALLDAKDQNHARAERAFATLRGRHAALVSTSLAHAMREERPGLGQHE